MKDGARIQPPISLEMEKHKVRVYAKRGLSRQRIPPTPAARKAPAHMKTLVGEGFCRVAVKIAGGI